MSKMSSFIIALIIIGLTSFAIGTLFGQFNEKYPTDYDSTSFESFNRLNNLTQQTKDIEETTNINERSGITDIIGGYFSSAYQSLKLTTGSISIFGDMADATAEKSGIDNAGVYKGALLSIVLIIIFVGIIITTMVKRES